MLLSICLFGCTSLFAQNATDRRGNVAPQVSVEPPPADARAAKKIFEEGQAAEEKNDWESAFAKYSLAVSYASGARNYWEARERARFRLMQEHLDSAERDALAARPWEAEDELYAALALDPSFDVARERLAQLQRDKPREPPTRRLEEMQIVSLRPEPGTRSFDYRGNTLGAYEEIARQFGLTVTFDQDMASKSVRFRLPDVDFFTAVRVLGEQTSTFIRALSERMFFVTNNTPEKRKQYEPQILRTVTLEASTTAEEMAEIRQAVREVAGITNPQLDSRTRQLTITGSPQAVALALELINEMERARGELMLEIQLFEVDRHTARKLGILPPSRAIAFTLTPAQIKDAQSSPEGLLRVLSQVFGSSGVPLTSAVQAVNQLNTGVINPASLIPPLIAFGGGKTVMLATLPGAAATFSDSFSVLRGARRVLLRADDGQQATFFAGDRIPISLGTISNSVTAPVVIVGGSITDFAVGQKPQAVATGDLNASGGPDFVVANTGEKSLSVFLNDGTGRFTAGASILTDDGPRALLLKDFNGDGKLDLVVAHERANTIAVLLGNGDGTFTAGSNFATLLQPSALASGEFTNDGNTDIVVTNEGSNAILLFPGNGDGTFGPGIQTATGTAPRALVAADFNGDGKTDLAVANSGDNTVSILLGDGTGHFTVGATLATDATPSAIAVGDFNADGKQDLAVTNQDADLVSVFLGNGDGTFGARTDYRTGAKPSGIVAADFSGDGRLDLAIANSGANAITLLAGLGDGTFVGVADLPVNSPPFALAVADFNADGRPDLVTANPEGNSATVLIGSAVPTTTPASAPTQLYPGGQYEDVGLKVRATPRLHANREVTLKLELEAKSLSLSSFNGIPVISSRTVEQMVRLKEGETSFLTGILSDSITNTVLGWPGTSSLPLVGRLTSQNNRSFEGTELIIAITPHTVRLSPRKSRLIYAGKIGEGAAAAEPRRPPQ